MTNQEKIDHLKYQSPLWKSLLLDKEIRYSDFLALFMETYKKNPFNAINLDDSNIIIRREYKHTDLWIDNNTEKNLIENCIEDNENEDNDIDDDCNIYEPKFLIENKLKSIPYNKQLIEYTQKFVTEYINSIRKEFVAENPVYRGKNNNSRINNDKDYRTKLDKVKSLSFHLISPINYDVIEDVVIDTPPILKGLNNLTYLWKQHTYPELGKFIEEEIKKSQDGGKDNGHGYLNDLFRDFAKVLQSMTIFSEDLKDNFHLNEPIIESFKPDGVFLKFKNMHDFYGKYRASQCAKVLNDRLNEKLKTFEKTQKLQCNPNIKHSFTNKSGLFEISREIDENITYIIQYQDGVLKKALVIPKDDSQKYQNWFLGKWTINIKQIVFKVKDNYELYSYKSGSDKMFYYSRYDLDNQITVENIIELMIENICNGPNSMAILKGNDVT